MSEFWKKYELIIAALCIVSICIVIGWCMLYSVHGLANSASAQPSINVIPTSSPDPYNHSKTYSIQTPEDAIREGERAKELLDRMSEYGTES